ncbi:MAG TPA: universal stress protein [Polyangiaceae bacterium]|nr:universal stress protein [Polyangiaceae bacterium]
MKSVKHILVPTDFEPASREALDWAVGIARSADAKVTLLHVWEIPIYPYMDFMLNSELISRVEDAAMGRVARALEELKSEVPNAQSILHHGPPSDVILSAIQETSADLVVMGTHGRRGVGHALLGSVAEKVVRLSPVAVLTVHAPAVPRAPV